VICFISETTVVGDICVSRAGTRHTSDRGRLMIGLNSSAPVDDRTVKLQLVYLRRSCATSCHSLDTLAEKPFNAFVGFYFYFFRTTISFPSLYPVLLSSIQFNLKLPEAVDEYYEVKKKCEAAGWKPGEPSPQGAQAQNASGPHRMLAQALMKRCIADIPIVQHIQKESGGMNKLYSQSMCSVKQWKAYQAAENMVSAEVDEVRAEADEIEPGWSQVIWRQAMQYHQMLKQRHEAEEKAREAMAQQKKVEEKKLTPEEQAKRKEEAAEKAAKELIQAEEREKGGKKAGSAKKGSK